MLKNVTLNEAWPRAGAPRCLRWRGRRVPDTGCRDIYIFFFPLQDLSIPASISLFSHTYISYYFRLDKICKNRSRLWFDIASSYHLTM